MKTFPLRLSSFFFFFCFGEESKLEEGCCVRYRLSAFSACNEFY